MGRGRNQSFNNFNNITCICCGAYGHWGVDCLENQNRRENNQIQGRFLLCGSNDHYSVDCYQNPYRKGGFSNNDILSLYCDSYGHYGASYCPAQDQAPHHSYNQQFDNYDDHCSTYQTCEDFFNQPQTNGMTDWLNEDINGEDDINEEFEEENVEYFVEDTTLNDDDLPNINLESMMEVISDLYIDEELSLLPTIPEGEVEEYEVEQGTACHEREDILAPEGANPVKNIITLEGAISQPDFVEHNGVANEEDIIAYLSDGISAPNEASLVEDLVEKDSILIDCESIIMILTDTEVQEVTSKFSIPQKFEEEYRSRRSWLLFFSPRPDENEEDFMVHDTSNDFLIQFLSSYSSLEHLYWHIFEDDDQHIETYILVQCMERRRRYNRFIRKHVRLKEEKRLEMPGTKKGFVGSIASIHLYGGMQLKNFQTCPHPHAFLSHLSHVHHLSPTQINLHGHLSPSPIILPGIPTRSTVAMEALKTN